MQKHDQRATQRKPDASREENPRLRGGKDRPARPEQSGSESDEARGVFGALLPEHSKFFFFLLARRINLTRN